MKFKSIAVALTAIALSTALSGCVSASDKNGGAENDTEISVDMPGALPPEEELPETPPAEENKPAVQPVEPDKPTENKISYRPETRFTLTSTRLTAGTKPIIKTGRYTYPKNIA